MAVRDREATRDPTLPAQERPADETAPRATTSMRDIRARERAQFVGIAWGSTLLGWFSAAGIVALFEEAR